MRSACSGFPAAASLPSAGPSQDCVVDKIAEFEKELSAPSTAPAERLLALKFLLHFVGDVHQPLHASDNQYRGGNCVHVSLGGQRTTNLHSFWDTTVLAPLGDDPTAIAKSLNDKISARDAKAWAAGSAEDWAEESYRAAKANAYTIGSPAGCTNDAAPIALSPTINRGPWRCSAADRKGRRPARLDVERGRCADGQGWIVTSEGGRGILLALHTRIDAAPPALPNPEPLRGRLDDNPIT